MKKLLLFIIAAAVAIYFSLGIIAKTVIESQVYEQTGVPLKVGFVSIEPFSGTATISDLSIANPNDFKQFDSAFSLGGIYASVDIGSLFNNPLHVKELRIDKPEVFVEMYAGQNNLMVLLEIKICISRIFANPNP